MADSSINVTEGSGKRLQTYDVTVASTLVQRQAVVLGEQPLASYIVSVGPSVVSTANAHLFQIMAGSSLRVRIRRIEIWQQAAITTGALFDFMLLRVTTAGTGGTASTPTPLDPADAACGATVQTLPSSKGTEGYMIDRVYPYAIQTVGASTPFTNPLKVWDFDQPRSKPLIIAAGTSNGIVIKLLSTSAAGGFGVTCWFDETAW